MLTKTTRAGLGAQVAACGVPLGIPGVRHLKHELDRLRRQRRLLIVRRNRAERNARDAVLPDTRRHYEHKAAERSREIEQVDREIDEIRQRLCGSWGSA